MRPPLGTGTQRAPDERPALLSAPPSIHTSQKQIKVSFSSSPLSVRCNLSIYTAAFITSPLILYLLFSPTSLERKSCKIIIFFNPNRGLLGD